jgi:glycyl-tRNA synthetase beta chain
LAQVNAALLPEPAEAALFATMQEVLPRAQSLLDSQDYTAALQTLAALRAPVDAFFEGVMVNAEAPELRANRLGLLKTLHTAMNQVADLARLAV